MMEPFLRYLHTYVSVSGPHLGYLYSSNSLFNSGLWFFKKLKSTQCIHQLTFTDDPDFQNTFLYKLCKVGKVSYTGMSSKSYFLELLIVGCDFYQSYCYKHLLCLILHANFDANWNYRISTYLPSKSFLYLKLISNVDAIFNSMSHINSPSIFSQNTNS